MNHDNHPENPQRRQALGCLAVWQCVRNPLVRDFTAQGFLPAG